MFTKTTLVLAFVLASASGALAATKQQSAQPDRDVYSAISRHGTSESQAARSANISNARGSVAHTRTSRLAPAAAVQGRQIRLDDCVHVTFPQCDGDAKQTQVDRR